MQAGRQVRGLAERQLFLPGASPHLPYHHQSSMDAQAHGQVHPPLARLCRRRAQPFLPQAGRKLPHGFDHPQPGPHGPLRIIFVRQGVAEIDEQAVAEILGDMPLKAGDHLGAGVLIGAHDLPELFGVKLRRERGRADQVTEEHGELPALGLGGGACDRRWCLLVSLHCWRDRVRHRSRCEPGPESGVPQPPQNFSPGSLVKPQTGQARGNGAPHSAQKRRPARFSH